MKKKIINLKPSPIEARKAKRAKYTVFKKRCAEIFGAFISNSGSESPGLFVNQITPWECFAGNNDENFERLYEAIQEIFAVGYVIGQGFDLPGIDTKPIWDLLREKETLIYFPHEKKAA
jgi:hypothetical protein